ncbi:MAG TPA: radical SAM protein [Candidatus Tumulicola sp.]|jgi:molybdenum cofactor biosynthesis enzyme MoaA
MNHVTILSNFGRAYDKYGRSYDKSAIGESTYPDRFFLLEDDDLQIGLQKATRLLNKTALPGDRLLVMRAEVEDQQLRLNERTGLGTFLPSGRLRILELRIVALDGSIGVMSVEEAYAAALRILNPTLLGYDALRPRSLSVLPVARACQAACKFCFSEASASRTQIGTDIDFEAIGTWCREAQLRGAQRFVITGGGEPGLVRHAKLVRLIALGAAHFPTVVLITNGIHLARSDEAIRKDKLRDYSDAGLSVLSISRHHGDAESNCAVMGVDTKTEKILATLTTFDTLKFRRRLICVLQKGGVDCETALTSYLDWAVDHDVDEVCFKELYVSTTLESTHYSDASNVWARDHQVTLELVCDLLQRRGFCIRTRLPWGSPIFEGIWSGRSLQVAAYTEPTLFWERANGIARSWNVMADSTCLASLEDPQSFVVPAAP